MLEASCRQLKQWRDLSEKTKNWKISVNASASQLRSTDFPETISRALGNSGLSSADLRIEITESALVESDVATEAQLLKLLMLGCDSAQGFLFERPLAPDECFVALSSPPRPPLGHKWM